MALDETPGEIAVKTRDQVRDDYTRDYALRVPTADVGPGTQPFVDASNFADGITIVLSDAQVIGRGTNTRTSAGQWLKDIGEPEGIFKRPPVGGSGAVTISTSNGGSNIQAGTELKELKSQLRFKTISPTALYLSGSEVAITGIDTGPGTNFKAGTVLQFVAPPPGCGLNATIVLQNDGTGLSGGRDEDTDEQYRLLIEERRANPPASGNDAEYQRAVQKTPGVSVEKCFTYPGILGPGTIGYCFTLRPSKPGQSRIPNAAEIALTYSYVVGQEPADDSVFACLLTAQPITVALRTSWAPGASSWYDVTPWPAYIAGDKVIVDGATTPTATTFRLTTATSTTTPQAGQTIGFYDSANQKFQRKRILSVAVVVANKSWDVVVDTSNAASDTGYTPLVGQAPSPYSASLDSLVPALLTYMDALGPGEQVASLPDPGRRQRRQPASPAQWSNVINNRIVAPLFAVSAVGSVTLLEPSDPTSTTVGTAGVQSYLLTLGDVAAFA